MASTSSTNFERSLDQFRDYLSGDQKQQFNAANLPDLNAEIQKIQARLGRDKRLCNFRRIEKFLDAMKHVEQLVSIFLNVHEVVAFVWVRLTLEYTTLPHKLTGTRGLLSSLSWRPQPGPTLSNSSWMRTKKLARRSATSPSSTHSSRAKGQSTSGKPWRITFPTFFASTAAFWTFFLDPVGYSDPLMLSLLIISRWENLVQSGMGKLPA